MLTPMPPTRQEMSQNLVPKESSGVTIPLTMPTTIIAIPNIPKNLMFQPPATEIE